MTAFIYAPGSQHLTDNETRNGSISANLCNRDSTLLWSVEADTTNR